MRLIDADALLEAICKKYFVGDSTAAKLIKDAQTIKHEPIDINEMVNRFLSWKLPENFSPDAGISFTPEFNKEYMASLGKPPMRHEPMGTNLFDYDQAKAMIEYILANAPTVQQSEPFGYFKAEPFGWTDCAETDEGAIALYEAPTVQREGWVSVPIEPTDEMLDAVLKGTPYVDDNKQLMREAYKAMIQAAPTDTE